MTRSEQVLSERARLKRIAEILCDAILANPFAADEQPSTEPGVASGTDIDAKMPTAGSAGDEEKVLRYLSLVGEASPMMLRGVLGLPRTSTYRVLNRLVQSGQIVGDGQTRTLIYRLGLLPPHTQRLELN